MRQLVLTVPLDGNGRVRLGERDWRYLSQVLRKETGDVVDARLADGSLRSMRVESVDRRAKAVTLVASDAGNLTGAARESAPAVGDSMPAISEVSADFPAIVLFQWILKGPRMDQVIRQATETGVRAIVPVMGERCLTSGAEGVGGGKAGRWERIVREALQQSGSPVPTELCPPVSPSRVKETWLDLAARIYGDAPTPCDACPTDGARTLVALVLTEAPLARKTLHEYLCNATGPVALAVGPEGGMTQAEIALLTDAGFSCVHFKTNILRAETAALYGIAATQSTLLESSNWQLKE